LTKVGIALLRIVVGFVFLVHGWNKFAVGFDAVAAGFAQMGVPAPIPVAVAVAVLEILAGGALLLGLWTRIAAALLSVNMLAAIYFAHWTNGFFVSGGGFEYTLVLLTALVAFQFTGPGVPALDQVLGRPGEPEIENGTETEPEAEEDDPR
jgi:putative oxidoreductase